MGLYGLLLHKIVEKISFANWLEIVQAKYSINHSEQLETPCFPKKMF